MGKQLVSRAEFARMCGVSAPSVSKACAAIFPAACSGKRIDLKHPDARQYYEEKTQPRPESPATGIDPLYEQVVAWCSSTGTYTKIGIQRQFKIGHVREGRITRMMSVAGLFPAPGAPPPPPPPAPVLRGAAAAREKRKQSDGGEPLEVDEDITGLLDLTLREVIARFGTDTRLMDYLNAVQKIEAIHEKRLKNDATEGKLISRDLVQVGVIDVFNSAHLRMLKDGAKSIAAGAVSKHAAGAELIEVEDYVADIMGSFIRPVKSQITRALQNA